HSLADRQRDDRPLDDRRAHLAQPRRRDGGERRRRRRVEALSRDGRRSLVLRRRTRRGTPDPLREMTTTAQPAPSPIAELPFRTRLAIFLRLLAIQGAWNYESLLGNGIGFCVEPALRLFPEGIHSERFKTALARESHYFNAHPYLASVAVGALARA